jgi:hypothetical protein
LGPSRTPVGVRLGKVKPFFLDTQGKLHQWGDTTALSEWKLFVEKEPQSDLSGQVKERIEKISAALKPRQR